MATGNRSGWVVILALASVVATTAGCGSRADHSDLQVASPPAEGEVAPADGEEAPAEGEAPAEEETTNTTADPAKAMADITTVIEEGINGANLADVDSGVAKVEDGESVRPTIVMVATNPAFSTATAAVKTVEVLDDAGCEAVTLEPPCAQVAFDISLNGQVALPDYKGYAVLKDETWLISKVSFCDLVALAGLICP